MKVSVILLIFLSYSQGSEISIQRSRGNISSITSDECHSRQKRYIIFPKGSSLQLAIELLPVFRAPNEVDIGPTIGVAWPLPTDAKHYLSHRRVKRNKNISPLMDSYIETHLSYFKNLYHPLKSLRMKRGVKLNNKFKIFDDLAMILDLFGMTSGLAWMLPDDPMVYTQKKMHQVFKRSVFKKVEALLHVFTFQKTAAVAYVLPSEPLKNSANTPRLKRDVFEKLQAFWHVLTLLMTPVVSIFRFGFSTHTAWRLPDDPGTLIDKQRHQRFKRSVFLKLEALWQKASGMNGKHCVLRALCESGQRTASKKPFITEILHKVFWINDEDEEHETHEDKIYRRAHRSVNQDCASLYPECGFSIFEMIHQNQ